mgnify:FL=1
MKIQKDTLVAYTCHGPCEANFESLGVVVEQIEPHPMSGTPGNFILKLVYPQHRVVNEVDASNLTPIVQLEEGEDPIEKLPQCIFNLIGTIYGLKQANYYLREENRSLREINSQSVDGFVLQH